MTAPDLIFVLYTFKDPKLLSRVARAVAPYRLIVHVDSKVEELPFRDAVAQSANVSFVQERTLVNWGGYSQVRAVRSLVREALKISTSDDDYVILLSGQDYPRQPVQELQHMLATNQGKQFLRAFRISGSARHYEKQIERRHARDLPLLQGRTGDRRLKRVRNAAIRLIEGIASVFPRQLPPPGLTVAQGGTHFVLTVGCLKQLEARVTPEIERYFARVFCAEEKFYHSLLASMPRENPWNWKPVPYVGIGQRHYANLHHIDPTLVRVYTDTDWRDVKEMSTYFFRKVESDRSARLLDLIDEELLGITRH